MGGLRAALLAALLGGVTALLALTPAAQRLERDLGLGLLYRVRGPVAVPDEAVVIAVNRRSVDWLRFHAPDYGAVAPSLARCLLPRAEAALAEAHSAGDLPRGLYACVVERLVAEGAALIVFDVLFAKTTPDDAIFATTISHAPVLLFERIDQRLVGPGHAVRLRESPRQAFSEAARATGMFVVEAPAGGFLEGYLTGLPEFPTLRDLASLAWVERTGHPLPARPEPRTVPVWFYGPPGRLPHLDLRTLLGAPQGRRLEGRVAFVGLSEPESPGAPDHFRVPVPGSAGRAMAGVEIMATAFLNRLHGASLAKPAPAAGAGIVAAFAALAALAAIRLAGRAGLTAIAALALGYGAVSAAAFTGLRLWLPVALPLLIVAPAALIGALALRYARTRRLVGRLTPGRIARQLLDAPEPEAHHLQTEPVSILLCDIVSSTSLADRLPPDTYGALMQRFYDLAAEPIDREGGLIVEFPGDGALAVFPASLCGPAHGAQALAAARAICRAVDGAGPLPGLPPEGRLTLRLALHSGLASTGDVGARSRSNYKALGDAVNLTFAIERHGKGIAPAGRHILLLSAEAMAEAGADPAEAEDLGRLALPGRPRPVHLHRLSP